MGKDMVLPKNIRQIGDIQGNEKIFLEDYVMTYIRKKEKSGEKGYLGIFLGEKQEKGENTYLFIRGILEVPPEAEKKEEQAAVNWRKDSLKRVVETHDAGEKEEQSSEEKAESTWMERMEKDYQEYFPDCTVQGCCVIGLYPTERMKLLSELLPESGTLIYHLQDQEETIYRVENGRYRQIKGYFVFYEQNRKMQEYMANVFHSDCVEKEGVQDSAIRSFRKKVKEKGLQKNTGFLKLASSFFVVTVLMIGAIAVNRIEDIRQVRNLITGRDTMVVENGQEVEVSVRDTAEDPMTVEYKAQVTAEDTTEEPEEEVRADAAKDSDRKETEEEYQMEVNAEAMEADTMAEENTPAEEMAYGTEEKEAAVEAGYHTETDAGIDTGEAASSESNDMERAAEELPGADSFWEEDTESQWQETASVRQTQAAYVIKEGDTLAEICNRYYGDLGRLEEICRINEITDADKIMPGQKIVLP